MPLAATVSCRRSMREGSAGPRARSSPGAIAARRGIGDAWGMTGFWAASALLPEGWARDVLIEADAAGWITAVTPGATPGAARRLPGHVIPGVPNLHSHAFHHFPLSSIQPL